MKSLRATLVVALITISAVLILLASGASAQSGAGAQGSAQKSFDTLKTLAGSWEGPVTVTPAMPEMDKPVPVHISLRVTSRGNALVHEMQAAGTPDDPSHYDHPVTMFYLDSDHLYLTHYCDAGNRPRMVAKTSPDGKTVEFDFVDLAGGNENGHMYHALFTLVDANHHLEDWTFMMPGDKPMHAHFDLQKTK